MKSAHRHRYRMLALAFILAAASTLIFLWDWNWLKNPIEASVERQTGRSFSIDGDLDVDPGWRPRIVMNNVRLGNPSWARTPEMFSAERADFTLELRELLSGHLLFPEVALTAPRIELEVAPANESNWQLARPAGGEAGQDGEPGARKGLPSIGVLRVDRGELAYFDPMQNTDVRVQVSTQMSGRSGMLRLKAGGRLRTLDFEAEAEGGSLLALAETAAPYAFDARFRVGRTRGRLTGTVAGLQAFRSMRLQLDIAGETAADLHRLVGLALPDTPPYHLVGRLVHEGERWTLEDFRGRMGDSDLSGDTTVTYTNGRPHLAASLRSQTLDLDDLAGFIGATPGTGHGETASIEQKRRAALDKARSRVLPDRPVNLGRLRSMDADVRFTGLSLRRRNTPLEDLEVRLVLDRGVLTLNPLNFGIAGGEITSQLVVDAREPNLSMQTRINFSRLDLARLLPGNSTVRSGAGLIGGRAELSGRGSSTAEILASTDGELGVAMRRGAFSNLLIEGLGLDAAEALRFLVGGDRTVRLRCAVMDLEARDGVLRSRSFVADTSDTNMQVEGTVSLRDEALDLTIRPLPKDFSPVALRAPLHLRGTFKDPDIRIDRRTVFRGGAAAVLGALVNPIAALLPLIETGPGKDEDCGALIAAVEQTGRRLGTSSGKPPEDHQRQQRAEDPPVGS